MIAVIIFARLLLDFETTPVSSMVVWHCQSERRHTATMIAVIIFARLLLDLETMPVLSMVVWHEEEANRS